MTVLLVAGIGVILAGLVAIGFGIPVKEFGFGNTLILTGTVGACTGLIMVSMAIAVRELKKFAPMASAADLAPPLPRRDLQLPPLDLGVPGATDTSAPNADDARAPAPLFSRDAPRPIDAPPPWQDEARRDGSETPALPGEADEPKRRNLLFSSTRRERERAEAAAQAAAAEQAVPPAPEPAQKSFEDAWPQPERPRADAFRRAARAPTTFSDTLPDAALIPDRHAPVDEPVAPAVTVLKSGVVDGMAYSLYSDGSIEAQMPEGMMRFASIDELREHLDTRI